MVKIDFETKNTASLWCGSSRMQLVSWAAMACSGGNIVCRTATLAFWGWSSDGMASLESIQVMVAIFSTLGGMAAAPVLASLSSAADAASSLAMGRIPLSGHAAFPTAS